MSAPGDRVTYDGQVYECVKIVPCTTKDGRRSHFSVWQANCAVKGCADVVQQNFPPNFPRRGVMLNRRCKAHRLPGVPVNIQARATVHQSTIAAAAWLHGYVARHPDLRPTPRFIQDAVVRDYPNMPPDIAAKLGRAAPNENARYQIIHRRLMLAQRIGILKLYLAGNAIFVGYGERDPDAGWWSVEA
jgi:hypothetical protein